MNTLKLLAVSLVSLVSLASSSGCSSSTSSPSGASTTTVSLGEFCGNYETRAKVCAKSYDAASCAKEYGCFSKLGRTDFVGSYLTCMGGSTCVKDDTCVANALTPILAEPATKAVYDSCMTKNATCKSGGKSFTDDWCSSYAGLTDSARTEMKACFDKPCEEISGCIDTFTTKYGCK